MGWFTSGIRKLVKVGKPMESGCVVKWANFSPDGKQFGDRLCKWEPGDLGLAGVNRLRKERLVSAARDLPRRFLPWHLTARSLWLLAADLPLGDHSSPRPSEFYRLPLTSLPGIDRIHGVVSGDESGRLAQALTRGAGVEWTSRQGARISPSK